MKYLNLSSFIQISTIKDEKSAAKFHYIKTVSGNVVPQSIAFRVVSIYWQGSSSVPLISEREGTDPHWKHLRCTHFASSRGSRDVIASLACVRLTGWPVAWNLRRAVLSADAGLLVLCWYWNGSNTSQLSHGNIWVFFTWSQPDGEFDNKRTRRSLSMMCMVGGIWSCHRLHTVYFANQLYYASKSA